MSACGSRSGSVATNSALADANAANSDTIRVKVQKGSEGATLPGYTYTQDAQDF